MHKPAHRVFSIVSLITLLEGCGSQEPDSPASRSSEASPASDPAVQVPCAGKKELGEILKVEGMDDPSLQTLWGSGDEEALGLIVGGAQAIPLWRKLRDLVPKTGRWPVVLGGEESLDSFRESVKDPDRLPPAQSIALGAKLHAEEWLKAREEKFREENQDIMKDLEGGSAPVGATAIEKFTIPFDIVSGRPLKSVYVALLPTSRSWEAPAHMNFGAWNECPEPSAHVAVMKYWHDAHGAEVVGMSLDVVEMEVTRPPASGPAALKLARQQFAYCEDIVTQGTGSLEGLAKTLLNGKVWFFWWD